jgi:Lsr2
VARVTQVSLVDDVDGSVASSTVGFSLDGKIYELDLSDKNAKKLRDAVAPFVAAARRLGGRARRATGPTVSTARTDREKTTAIRAWAREHGHKVADRGRIPRSVLEAYEKAGG